jgi:hypothetical protein
MLALHAGCTGAGEVIRPSCRLPAMSTRSRQPHLREVLPVYFYEAGMHGPCSSEYFIAQSTSNDFSPSDQASWQEVDKCLPPMQAIGWKTGLLQLDQRFPSPKHAHPRIQCCPIHVVHHHHDLLWFCALALVPACGRALLTHILLCGSACSTTPPSISSIFI